MIELQQYEFDAIKEYLLESSGIDIPIEKRYLFTTRLTEFLTKVNCTSFLQLHQMLTKDPVLHQNFVESMTTHETSFFRDGHPYQVFQNILLPEIVKMRKAGAKKIYIWSLACSTGQEPYSLSIAIHEWCSLNRESGIYPSDFVILAGDISERVLAIARRGVYTKDEVARGISESRLMTYFKAVGGGFEVIPKVRELVQFSQVNISKPMVFIGKFDLILCRNVMIYFSTILRRKIISQFKEMLQPEGFLVLGASETLYGMSEGFEPCHYGETIVYRSVK